MIHRDWLKARPGTAHPENIWKFIKQWNTNCNKQATDILSSTLKDNNTEKKDNKIENQNVKLYKEIEAPEGGKFRLYSWKSNYQLWTVINHLNRREDLTYFNTRFHGLRRPFEIYTIICRELIDIDQKYNNNDELNDNKEIDNDTLQEWCVKQHNCLVRNRNEFNDVINQIINSVKDQKYQENFNKFLRDIYLPKVGIKADLDSDEVQNKIMEVKATIEPYISRCLDKWGRMNVWMVALQGFDLWPQGIAGYANEILQRIEDERYQFEQELKELKKAGRNVDNININDINVFYTIDQEEIVTHICDIVADAATFLDSIPLIKLANDYKILESDDNKLCRGFGYVPIPRDFMNNFIDFAKKEKGKTRNGAVRGITVEGIFEYYNSLALASCGYGERNKYKARDFKYPPKWVIEKQNQLPGENNDRRSKLPYKQLEKPQEEETETEDKD